MHNTLGLYISIPFCKAKCTFCNFASDAFAPARMDRYVDRLCAEIASARTMAASLTAQLPDTVDTLYFGGGTPSLLEPRHIDQIFAVIKSEFTFTLNPEITLEAAPGQLTPTSLEAFQREHLNRVSLGVQSFIDRESFAIGRLHTRRICLDEISRLRAAGIKNFNLDLIAGLPHQTESSWQYSLDEAIKAEVPHISVYMLEVDEHSRLGAEILAHGARYGAATVPTDDQSAALYQLACDRLNAAGISQYEISNFARPGHQSRHNLKYWLRHPYLGFGLDAHSMLLTADAAVRFSNTDNLDLYSADSPSALPLYRSPLPPPEVDRISETQAFEESLFLGLRLNAGVNLNQLRANFGASPCNEISLTIEELITAGLLASTQDTIALTDRGRMLSIEVFSRLLLTPA